MFGSDRILRSRIIVFRVQRTRARPARRDFDVHIKICKITSLKSSVHIDFESGRSVRVNVHFNFARDPPKKG